MLTVRIQGLDVQGAPISDEPTLLCYTPATTVEGDHVGAVVFRLDLLAWCPVNIEFFPLDADGEVINTTFGDPDENRARIKHFDDVNEAVRWLASWWNRNNPSQAVSLGKAA